LQSSKVLQQFFYWIDLTKNFSLSENPFFIFLPEWFAINLFYGILSKTANFSGG
jgi:hypothetical protein